MKKVVLLFLCMLHFIAYGQESPYKFSWRADGIIGASLLAGTATHFVLQQSQTALTYDDVSRLSATVIPPYDRIAASLYNPHHVKTSKRLLIAGVVTSVGIEGVTALAASKFSQSYKNNLGIVACMWLQVNVAAYIGPGITKSLVHRPRPFVYNSNVPDTEKITVDAHQSFFSRHTSLTAANTFLAAHVISKYYMPSAFTSSVWAVAAVLPAAVGYFRVTSGEHFPTDVIAGYVYGAACGLVIPYVHTLHDIEKSHVRINAISPDYISVSLVW